MKKNTWSLAVSLVSLALLMASHTPGAQAAPFVVDFAFPTPVTQGSPVTFTSTTSGNTGTLSYQWRFSDGTYLGSGSILTYVFSTAGAYTLALQVYDAGTGATVYASHSVNVQPTPVRTNWAVPSGGTFGTSLADTVGSPVTFSASASGGAPSYRFSWDFGDGGTGSGIDATHTYAVSGVFLVVERVTDADGFVAVASSALSISTSSIVADFTVPATVTQNVPATFTPSVSGYTGSLSYQWRLSDGTYLSSNNVLSQTFPNPGNQTLVLWVYDSGTASSAFASHRVIVRAAPVATDFSFPTPVTQGSPVTFTATGLYGASPGAVAWTFGDSGTTTGNPATHTYTSAGPFTVTLTVTFANGTLATIHHTVSVASSPLSVDFTFPAGTTQGSPVVFTATVSNGVPPFSYTWYFGDGAFDNSNANPIAHTYTIAGNYTVTLVVYDSNGAGRVQGVASHSLTVGLPGRSLAVDFAAASAPTKDSPVTLVATVTFGSPPYSFSWNFGDGNTGTGAQSTHTYSSAGLFNVSLRVTDQNGAVATANHPQRVLSTVIQADFSFTASITQGSNAVFVSSVTGNIGSLNYAWRLGDGTYLGGGSAIGHTFSTPGNYTISLFVSDSASGASAWASHAVVVTASPLTAGITGASGAGANIGSPYTWTGTAVGGTPPYSFSWDFGDGSAGSGIQATHTYTATGPFIVVLKVTDSSGSIAVTSGWTGIIPASSLSLDFSYPSPVTQGSPVTFSATLTGATGSIGFYWRLEDGSNLYYGDPATSVQPLSYTFNTPGIHTIYLYVIDHGAGASVFAGHAVLVRPTPPTVDFSFPTPVTAGSPVTFTATGAAGASSVTWAFGDGGTGTGVQPTHIYSAAGTPTAVVTVHLANGAVTSASHPVSVQASPVKADFSFPSTNQGNPVTFNATVSGGVAPYQFYWYFGDGGSDSSNVNPVSHTYSIAGNYTVLLIVYDSNPNGRAIATASHAISVSIPRGSLEADFSGFNDYTQGSPVTFSATASFGAAPYAFSWNFGDGSSGTGNPVTHTFANAGLYIVVLTVTDANGAVATVSHFGNILSTPVKADFVFATISRGSPATFNATVSGGVTPYQFYWYFGDGLSDSSNSNPIQHTYSASGTYLPTLLVYDSNTTVRHYAYATHAVVVSLPRGSLQADFSGFNGYTQGSPVTFAASASFGTRPYAFAWSFGDRSTGTGSPVTHTFTSPGTYLVVLTVTDANGAVATVSHYGSILQTPVRADFSFPAVSQGSTVAFNATVSGSVSPYQFYWYFGDGLSDSSNSNPIQHTYSASGTYLPTLLVYDSNTTVRHYAYATHAVVVSLPRGSLQADFSGFNGYTQGSPVTFAATVSFGTPPYTYSWDFGDHTTGIGRYATHTYSTAGQYLVVLKVTDANGAVATASRIGTIISTVIVTDFSSSNNPVEGSPVTFTGAASGGVTPYQILYWYFGDGATDFSNTNPIQHTYAAAGTYVVTFLVEDSNSPRSYAYATHTVSVSRAARITLDFSSSPYAGFTAGSPISWSSRVSGGTGPFSFAWTFGDGATGTGSQATHTYANPGSFNITLKVTDSLGTTGAVSHIVSVLHSSLMVDFSYASQITQGSSVVFVSSVAGNTGGLGYSWRLADGTYLGGASAVGYTFGSPGNYTLALYVSDSSSSASAFASRIVTVNASPLTATINGPAGAGFTIGSPITWTASAVGGNPPYAFNWDFGDGNTGSGVYGVHTYSSPGPFIVVLKVTDSAGAEAIAGGWTGVLPSTSLRVDFSFTSSITQGSTAVFVSNVNGNVGALGYYNYAWRLGDGTYIGGGSALGYTFNSPGNYTVSLVASDSSGGASAYASHGVVVRPSPLTAGITGPTGAGLTIGSPFTWTGTAVGGTPPYSFAWDWGDGSTGSGAQAAHTYSSTGPYIIVLKVTDSAGNVAFSSGWTGLIPGSPLAVNFSFASSVTQGSPVAFTATESGGTAGYSYTWYFGDGIVDSSNTNPISHTYATAGNYTVALVIYDSNPNGRVFAATSHTVRVTLPAAALEADFTTSPVTVGGTVAFSGVANFGNPPYTLAWNFGDGTTATGNQVSHTYSIAGLVTAVLTVTDASGTTATVSRAISVVPTPVRNDFSLSAADQGSPVTFSATASGGLGPYRVIWYFGDGTSDNSNTNPISHTYAIAGNYTVTLLTYDSSPNTNVYAYSSHWIPVGLPRSSTEADFSFASGTVGNPTTFTATASFGTKPYTFAWAFGDGTTKSGNPVTHTYSLLGSYTITLTVSDAHGATATVSHNILVISSPVNVDFSTPPASQASPVGFLATPVGGVTPYQFYWYFGDGTTDFSNVNPASHTYAVAGNYTVELVIRDSNPNGNVLSVASHWLMVSSTRTSLAGDFSSPTVAKGSPATFTGQGFFGAPPYSFAWDFGDRTSGTGALSTHTYSSAGFYTVVLTITDGNGGVATASHVISVLSTPVLADFSFPGPGSQGSPVTFTGTVSGGVPPYAYYWYFGDGTNDFSNTNPVSHTYTAGGNYTVSLVAYDSNSTSRAYTVASHPIRILPIPAVTADFSFPTPGTFGYGGYTSGGGVGVGQPVTLTATAAGGTPPYSFSWTFGDGTTGTGVQTTHAYTTTGSFTIVLTVSDSIGTTTTASRALSVVSDPIHVDFSFPTPVTQGTGVGFNATVTGTTGTITYDWRLGDGTRFNYCNGCYFVGYTFATLGNYTVVLLVFNGTTTVAIASHSVKVLATPVRILSTTIPTLGQTGYSTYGNGGDIGTNEPFTWTAVAAGGTLPYTFNWDFGDGTSGAGFQVTHSYSSSGVFMFVLRVTDAAGFAAMTNGLIRVASVPVHADFSFPTPVTQGTGIGFNATVTGTTGTVYYDWRLGDGTRFNYCTGCPFVGYTFTTPGNYTVALVVYDYSGTNTAAIVSHIVKVTATPVRITSATEPTLGLMGYSSYGNGGDISPGEPIQWKATATGGTLPYTFTWDFGDHSGGTGSDLSHKYSSAGLYMVVLRVTDVNGNVALTNGLVSIRSVPIHADFSFPTPVTQGTGIGFNATVTGTTGTVYYDWRLGDGTRFNYCTGCPFVGYTFTTPGNYTVALVVYDSGTNTAAIVSHSVKVLATPVRITSVTIPTSALFGSGNSITVGSPIALTAVVSGGTPPYSFSWDFGDGTTGTGLQVTHRYSSAGVFMLVLRVTDASGFVSLTNGLLNVGEVPVQPDFTYSTPALTGSPVTFTATTVGGTPPYSYSWNFGDGSTSTGNPATHTFAAMGVYTVTLSVTDANGLHGSVSHRVGISLLHADFSFNPSSPTTGQPDTFTATITGGTSPYTITWDFGDGTTGAGSPVSHTYSNKGTYAVTLNATDSSSPKQTSTVIHTITVRPVSLAVTITCGSATVGKPVTCSASVTGGTGPYTLYWSSNGNIPTGTGANYTTTFAAKGPQTISLTAYDANGANVQGSKSLTILPQQLAPDFTFNPPSPSSGQQVSFTATLTGGTSPYTFTWDFGDTTTGTGASTTHTYTVTSSTTFTVILTAKDANGVTATAHHTLTISPVTITVTVTCGSATAGKPVTCSASGVGGTGTYSFAWSAAGGNPATGSTSSFTTTFATKGTKSVTATATDGNGAVGSGSANVVVAAQPIVVAVTCGSATAGKPVTCSAAVTGGSPPYGTVSWSAPNGNPATGTGASFTTTYPAKASNTITATVTDANGATKSGTANIVVAAQPLGLDFTIAPTTPSSGQQVTFTALATGGTGPYTFSWNFGDTHTATGSPATHAYTVSTTTMFTVKLNATDANGATKTATHTVAVSPVAITVTVACGSATAGKPVTCNATSSGGTGTITFSWKAPNGNPSTGTGASFTTTYAAKGTDTITANATDATGSKGSGSATITVTAQPLQASFTCGSATAGKPVSCDATATGGTGPYTFGWKFGDEPSVTRSLALSGNAVSGWNGSSTNPNPTITVHQGDVVTVLASSADGITHRFFVDVDGNGVVPDCPGPDKCSSNFPPQTIFTFNTNFGPGTYNYYCAFHPSTMHGSFVVQAAQPAATGSHVSHSYAVKGGYTVNITATDANGAIATITRTVNVSAQQLTITITPPSTASAGKPASFSATASGGTGPYSVSWDFGDGTPPSSGTSVIHTFATKGSYTVHTVVTDGNGATASTTTTVVVAAQRLVPDFTDAITGQTVEFTATATGGSSPYTFTWDFGDTTTGTGSPVQHSYTVTATTTFHVVLTAKDANGVTATAAHDVVVTPVTITVTATCGSATAGKPVTCNASAVGGTGTYTFTWSAPNGSPATGSGTSFATTFAGKGSDSVTATATDANGNTGSKAASVIVAAQSISVAITCGNATAGKPVTCNATATGGTAPYTFSWTAPRGSPATGSGSSFTTSYAAKGTFVVNATATDNNGAHASKTASIVVAGQPIVVSVTCGTATVGKPVTCNASATGGTAPYTFTWASIGSPATGTGSSYTSTFATKGTVEVNATAKDANNLSRLGQATITVAGQPIVVTVTCSTATAGKPVTCNASATGGTGSYSFTWASKGNPATGAGSSYTTTFPSKGSQVINATTRDTNGVSKLGQATINVAAQPILVTITCGTATARMPVTCTASATGGTTPYTFAWASRGSPAAGTGSSYTTTFSNPGSQTINATATDNNGVSKLGQATISVLAGELKPQITCANGTAGKPITCNGTAVGTFPPFTFTWSSHGTPSTATGASYTVTFNAKGSYTIGLNVTDSGSPPRSASTTAIVVVSGQPIVVTVTCGSATAGKPVSCSASESGGTGPYAFSWSSNGNPGSGTGTTYTTTFSSKGSQVVNATARDANAASQTGTANVLVAAQPIVVTVTCGTATAGKSVTCSAVANGGTSPYTFSWSALDGTPSTATGASFTTTYAVKGSKTVNATATDNNGSMKFGLATVNVGAQPIIVTITCGTASVGLPVTCNASATGGTPPYTFAWASHGYPASGTGATYSTTFASMGSETINATATDTNHVSHLGQATVTVSENPIVITVNCPSSGTTNKAVNCTAIASGGTLPYTFSWSSNGDPATATGSSYSTTLAAKGTLIVNGTVTDSSVPHRQISQIVRVSIGPQPIVVTVSCGTATAGKPVTCIASATGGTPPYTLTWGSIGSPPTGTGPSYTTTFTAKGSQTVTVTATDSNNVSKPGTASITVTPQELSVDFTPTPMSPISGQPVRFVSTASGGTSPYVYSWNFGDGSPAESGSSTQHTYNVTTTTSFQIKLTMTDSNHANTTSSHSVTVSPPHATTTTVSCTSPVVVTSASACTVHVMDVSAHPAVPTVPTGTVNFSTDSSGSFTGSPCTLSGSSSAASCQVTYTPGSVGSGTQTITARYSGDPTHATSHGSTTLTVTSPPDFTISANPTSLVLAPEDSENCHGEGASGVCDDEGQSTITVTFLNGFTGQVNLTASSSPHINTGLKEPSLTATGSTTLKINEAAPGNYTITVTGTSGTTSRHVIINVTVRAPEKLKCGGQDKDCQVESDAPLSNVGFEGHTMRFTLTGEAGTSGAANVTIDRSTVPDINRVKVFVDGNQLSRSDLTISSDDSNYHIYFKVTFHSPVNIEIDVNPTDTVFGIDTTTFYGSIVGVFVAGIAATLFVGYGRKHRTRQRSHVNRA